MEDLGEEPRSSIKTYRFLILLRCHKGTEEEKTFPRTTQILCLVGARSCPGPGSGASREHTLHSAKCFRKSKLTDQKHKRKTKASIRPLHKLRPPQAHNAYKAKVSFTFPAIILHRSSQPPRLQAPRSQRTEAKHH